MVRQLNHLLGAARGALRVSTLLRVVWLAVALLHVWLIVRRCVAGDWQTVSDYLRGGLCLAGVGYATLKVWRVATVFDNEPRRAWVFGLVLLLGHAFAAQPGDAARALERGETAALIAALATVPAVGLALLLIAGAALRKARLSGLRAPRRIAPATAFETVLDLVSLPLMRGAPQLARRPPPCH